MKRTCIPSHIVRRATFERLACPNENYLVWIEHMWALFMRQRGYKRRNVMIHKEFDRYLETLK